MVEIEGIVAIFNTEITLEHILSEHDVENRRTHLKTIKSYI